MAMVANDLRDLIKSKMATMTGTNITAVNAHLKLAEAIKEYLESNAEFTFVWTAVSSTPVPTPDLMTGWKGKISFTSFTLSPSDPLPLPLYGTKISTQVCGGKITPYKKLVGAVESSFAVGETLTVPTIKLSTVTSTPPSTNQIILALSMEQNPDGALLYLATQIISGVKTMLPIPNAFVAGASHVLSGITYVPSVNSMILIS